MVFNVITPYLKLGSKLIFLACHIVEEQEWVAGLSYRVSGGLSAVTGSLLVVLC